MKWVDEKILTELRVILVDVLCLDDPTEVTMKSRYVEDLRVDSIDMLSILLEVQRKYNMEIPSEEMQAITTVGETVTHIRRKLDAGECSDGGAQIPKHLDDGNAGTFFPPERRPRN